MFKIKLGNLRWVPGSVATRLPSAQGVELHSASVESCESGWSQGGSPVPSALSKEKRQHRHF